MIFADGGWIQPEHLGLPIGRAKAREALAGLDIRNGSPSLNSRQEEALKIAAEHGSVRRADLTARFRVSAKTARQDLVALVHAGFLCREGRRRGSRYTPA